MQKDRRVAPTLRETLTFSKEIPLSWLITLMIAAGVNFTAMVWMAATIVGNINNHDKNISDLQVRTTNNTTLIAAQTVLLQAQQVMIMENKEGLKVLADRFNNKADHR